LYKKALEIIETFFPDEEGIDVSWIVLLNNAVDWCKNPGNCTVLKVVLRIAFCAIDGPIK
jgi:hypothetical protein